MRLPDLIKALESLKEEGFIPTKRKGPTGIGHLLENMLGLTETNIAFPILEVELS